MDISIVIVNYNVRDFLFNCLRSIRRAEKNLKVETIVIDNNSTDGSVPYLRNLFPEVKFIEQKDNIGFGRANNAGFELAKGKYILILNPDTIVEEQTLDVMYDYMESHPEVGISGCKVLNPDGTFQLACRRGFPTPWASFCKLFGLQRIFPNSPLFARYNQTFRNEDESYYIDSVIGAFMFARKEAIDMAKGFDPDFFMYGEDLDLCYRVFKSGWKIAYVHTTSIIHYKGESTRRSSINEVRHFYQAMQIFATKHYAHSYLFLLFLKVGIALRSVIAYIDKYKESFVLMLFDVLAVNLSLLAATRIRFGAFTGFPDYAYPVVFIVLSIVIVISMIGIGEYFESKSSIRKLFLGLMVSSFVLSSLTYFFKDFAFSRGVLLMTIGFTLIIAAFFRIMLLIPAKFSRNEVTRRIALIGNTMQSEDIISKLKSLDNGQAELAGIVTSTGNGSDNMSGIPTLGNMEYLPNLIREHGINEVIITDPAVQSHQIIKMIVSNPKVRFHIAQEYEEVLTARIVNDIAGFEPTIPKYNYTKFRYRLGKRLADLIISLILLTIGLPVVYLLSAGHKETIKSLWKVFTGKHTLIGIYPLKKDDKTGMGKPGIMGLAHSSNPESLSDSAIGKLNDYYLRHCSFSLDLDIFLKYLLRQQSGYKIRA